MNQTEPVIDVIFRVFPEGAVIAMFPGIPGTYAHNRDCQAYMHGGQHGPAALCLPRRTRQAKPEQYASLVHELKSIGYRLRIVQRRTRKHDDARLAGAVPTVAFQGGAI